MSFDDDADLDAPDATITNVEVDDVAYPAAGRGDSVNVDADSTLTFTIAASATEESVIPVVHDTDTGDAITEEDDTDFGIGGATVIADVAELDVDPASATNRHGEEHAVTITLDSDDADDEVEPVELEGQDINVAVFEPTEGGPEVDPLECPTDIADLTNADEIELDTVQTDASGQAQFSYSFDDEDEVTHCIVAEWDGDDDRGYGPATGDATKTWSDADPVIEGVEFAPADGDELYNPTGEQHTASVKLTDQFGDPIEGREVRFDIDDGDGFTATTTDETDAEGEASYTYTGPTVDREDTVTATVLNEEGDADTSHTASHTKHWISSGVENVDDGEFFPSIQAADAGDLDEGETLEVFGDAAPGGAVTEPGVTVTGNGTLVENDDAAGSVLNVQAAEVNVDSITVDGENDSDGAAIGIFVQADDVSIDDVEVADVTGDSQGGVAYGVAVWNSDEAQVANTQVTNSWFDNLGATTGVRGVGVVLGHDDPDDDGLVVSAVAGQVNVSGNTFDGLVSRDNDSQYGPGPAYGVNVKNLAVAAEVDVTSNDFTDPGNNFVAVNMTEITTSDGEVDVTVDDTEVASDIGAIALRNANTRGMDDIQLDHFLLEDTTGIYNDGVPEVGYYTVEEHAEGDTDDNDNVSSSGPDTYTYPRVLS